MTAIRVAGIDPEVLLNCLDDSVTVLDSETRILWANQSFQERFGGADCIGERLYSLLDRSEIQGLEKCPIEDCCTTGRKYSSRFKQHNTNGSPTYYHLDAVCLEVDRSSRIQRNSHSWVITGKERLIVVTIKEIVEEIHRKQKLAAIHHAGAKLIDLKPNEIFTMDVDQRIELLKENIRNYTKDLLNIDVVEIRLLEKSTGNLIPLLSVGVDQVAARRRLTASLTGNEVTGYVAASAVSYLCRDTATDPMYPKAFKGARSSLTVPILWHNEVIGTVSAESPKLAAFSEGDQQFLEIFARHVAVAINTLELLVAQRTDAAQQSYEAIRAMVAVPLDDLLVEAAYLLEKYNGHHDTETVGRLRNIFNKTRSIKSSIQEIGQILVPTSVRPAGADAEIEDKLHGKRILVVDSDTNIREEAHRLLAGYGCVVDTVRYGEQALEMVRNSEERYDVIFADVKLPEYSGYQLMLRLQKLLDHVPLALMIGFGYDPGHSIVKARQAGLHRRGIVYKPFHLGNLLETILALIDDHSSIGQKVTNKRSQPLDEIPYDLDGRPKAIDEHSVPPQKRTYGPVQLRIQNLTLTFGGPPVLSNINAELRQGEVVSLMGPNGAGKSTLINVLTGNLPPDSGSLEYTIGGKHRSYSFPTPWWKTLSAWNPFRPNLLARLGIGRTWQEARLFRSLSLQDNILVAARSGVRKSPLAAFGFKTNKTAESSVIPRLGLEGAENLTAYKASQGRSKQVAIAQAVAAGAKVLFLDEPLSGIDRSGIGNMIKFLKDLIEDHQLTLVIIEHEFNWRHLLPLVTTSWELVDGKLTCKPAEWIPSGKIEQSRDDWVQALIDAGKECVEEDLPRGAKLTRIRISEPVIQPPALDVNQLNVTLGDWQLFADEQQTALDFRLNRGEIAILEAPNGWGKTTLFKILSQQILPASGSWTVDGRHNPGYEMVNCVPASGILFPSLTVREVAAVARRPLPPRFQALADRSCSTLSGGERQRLALSLASPKVLNVYDEPINGLDWWKEFVDSCIDLANSGQAVLVMVPKRTIGE